MSEAVTASNPWQTDWKDKLHHIDELVKEHKIGAAIQYIFTSFFIYLGKFTEDYRMDRQAKIMHELQQVQSLRNRINQDFQSFNTVRNDGSLPSPSQSQIAAAQDALSAYKQLDQILQSGEKKGYFTSEFVTGFESHFFSDNKDATIFQATDASSTNSTTLATAWISAWYYAGDVGSNSNNNPNPASGLLGVINNQFNEAKTTSQSSVVQSKLNYWSKQDTTDKSVVHMGLSSLSSIEKTANNNLGK